MPQSIHTVWYVAYGSNLFRPRLQRYLDRVAGGDGPLDVRPTTLEHRLFFAHESGSWTGGSAFVDPAPGGPTTRARAWLLTTEQFAGVLAQENGRRHLGLDRTVFELPVGGRRQVDERRYGLVLGCPSPDARPALTFTTPASPLPEPNPPSERYVATIVAGLVDGHGLNQTAARAYVTERVGR